MLAKDFVFGNMVNDYRCPTVSNLPADGCFDLEFSARRQAKGDLIVGGQADPSAGSNPGDSRESHPSDAANDIENLRYRFNSRDGVDISLKLVLHFRA
jgi:hypothetical protein